MVIASLDNLIFHTNTNIGKNIVFDFINIDVFMPIRFWIEFALSLNRISFTST